MGTIYPVGEITCAGCGRTFVGQVRQDRPTRYCTISCASTHTAKRGEENVRYNGGLCFHQGRWMICCRDGTVMLYSRGVMAAQIGRLLRSDEIVHHRNEQTDDDRPENLQIVSRAEHIAMHRSALQAATRRRSRLTVEKVAEIRQRAAGGETYAALGRAFGVQSGSIRQVVLRQSWK